MQCEAIRPVIRQFLDDLLDEKDYQEIHEHLTGCTRCHSYASSVGTLSYRLFELGQVLLPPDMVSTILYELRHEIKPEPGPAAAAFVEEAGAPSRGTPMLWIVLLLLLGGSIAATWAVFGMRKAPAQSTPPAALSSLSPVEPQPFSVSGTTVQMSASLPERHYHLSGSSRSELAALAQGLGLTPESESGRLFVFNVPRQQLGEFEQRFSALNGVVKEFGEPEASEASAGAVRVSVYFE